MSRELVIPHLGPFISPDPSHADLATNAALAAHEAASNPHVGYATDTDLTAHEGDWDAHTLPYVKARIADATGSTISTTEAVEQTLTVTIPGTWATYDLEAFAVCELLESGTLTGQRTITVRLRRGTTVGGTSLAFSQPTIDIDQPNRFSVSLLGVSEGETATGGQSVVFTTAIPADTGQTSYDHFSAVLTAWRTS